MIKKHTLLIAALMIAAAPAAFAASDWTAQDRLGQSNADYFKAQGEIPANPPTIATPKNPAYDISAEPIQRINEENYQFFNPTGTADTVKTNGEGM